MKNRSAPYLVLFDIDSTLLISNLGKTIVNKTFIEVAAIPDAWGNTSTAGKTDLAVFQEIASRILKRPLIDKELSALFSKYVDIYAQAIDAAPRFIILPHAAYILELLSKKKDCFLGIQTGNIPEVAAIKLRNAGLEKYFQFGGYGATHYDKCTVVKTAIEAFQLRHPTIKQHTTYVIGDAPSDMIAATANDCIGIGITTGNANHDILVDAGANYVCSNLSEIASIIPNQRNDAQDSVKLIINNGITIKIKQDIPPAMS